MPRYEEKIARFAQGKEFLRLSRPVRGRADAVCDACGSTQPRTLYGLADVESGRHYFVGDSCLKELVKRGSILRRFGKQSGIQAYHDEMQLRANSVDQISGPVDGQGNTSGDIASKTVQSGSGPVPAGGDIISSQVLMFETPEHYQCFVALIHVGANHAAFGTACVAKYEERSRPSGVFGLVLENLKQQRPDAPVLCLAQAWQEAYSNLEGTGATGTPTLPGNFPGVQIETDLVRPGVLKPVATPATEAHH